MPLMRFRLQELKELQEPHQQRDLHPETLPAQLATQHLRPPQPRCCQALQLRRHCRMDSLPMHHPCCLASGPPYSLPSCATIAPEAWIMPHLQHSQFCLAGDSHPVRTSQYHQHSDCSCECTDYTFLPYALVPKKPGCGPRALQRSSQFRLDPVLRQVACPLCCQARQCKVQNQRSTLCQIPQCRCVGRCQPACQRAPWTSASPCLA
mmetsp:Transcript_126561/g.244010  ORF Transcript_126561/g.244010 Transcript_126561/m.244010 type:complete len:207 (-) Transcript_126561:31-651(-)